MKTCNKCNIEKDISDFYKSKSSSDGLYSSCKDCDRLRRMEYYESNRLSIIEKKKEYVENNIEKVKDYQSIYRFKNKDRLKENLNKEYHRKWWENNKEKSSLYGKKYRSKYPHVKACRNILRCCIDRLGLTKESSTFEILKYTPDDLKLHMESLFSDGMSWDNYGQWHIDHIIPVSKFDRETPLSIINSLDNLQPLWAKDNLSKSNRI